MGGPSRTVAEVIAGAVTTLWSAQPWQTRVARSGRHPTRKYRLRPPVGAVGPINQGGRSSLHHYIAFMATTLSTTRTVERSVEAKSGSLPGNEAPTRCRTDSNFSSESLDRFRNDLGRQLTFKLGLDLARRDARW